LSKKHQSENVMLGFENKAATNAITNITNNSEHQDLVQDLLAGQRSWII
jgi:hypothetical protein